MSCRPTSPCYARSMDRLAHDRQRNEEGFTLVELLVVIAIIGILVALLLPAVQASRSAARRIHCKNQLKQMGLAVLNFESARRSLPVAGLVTPEESDSMFAPNFKSTSGPQIGWMVLILPFLEEQPLYDQFEIGIDASVFDQIDDPQARAVQQYLCPSDQALGRQFVHPAWSEGKPLAKGNFAAYISPQHIGDQQFFPGALGGFQPGDPAMKGQRMAQIRDGASRTLLATEVIARDDERDPRGAWAVPWGAASVLAVHIDHLWTPNQSQYHQSGVTHYVPDPEYLTWAHTPNNRETADLLLACPRPIQSKLEGVPCLRASTAERLYVTGAARSRHPGGVNAVALDGHVGFMNDDIDAFVLAHLVSAQDLAVFQTTEYLH